MKKISFRAVFLLTGIVCLFNTCKKLPPPDEFDPSGTRLHVVWKKSFYADSSQAVMLAPIITDRYVSVLGISYGKLENHIVVFDKTNGERHPVWQNGISCETNNTIAKNLLAGGSNKDILFCATPKSLRAFSIPTGQPLWTSIYDENNGYFNGYPIIFGSDILAISPIKNICHIDQYNSYTGQKTTLFSFNEYANAIQWAVNEQKDTLFFFFNFQNTYCYNLTKDSIVWKNTLNIEYNSPTSFHPIIVENKYVLFQRNSTVSCVDFYTGELIWTVRTYPIPDNPILYHEGKIVVRPNYESPSCYDVRTGDLLWKNTDLNMGTASNFKMDTYKGNLYFTIEQGNISNPPLLYCLSLATGTVNWSDPGPDKGIIGSITIDQQTGYLYCSSRQSVMCIDLNKTPKK